MIICTRNSLTLFFFVFSSSILLFGNGFQLHHQTRHISSSISNRKIRNQQQNELLLLQSGSRSSTTSRSITQLYEGINGESSSSSQPKSNSPTFNIIPKAQSRKSQLISAFSALDETDQYDAVLTGLCAKMLDSQQQQQQQGNTNQQEEEEVSIEDPVRLLQEMNGRNIAVSPRSLMALIDATVTTQDADNMSRVLSLCARNRKGITQYGIAQRSIIPMPITSSSSSAVKVLCPDGTRKTRKERLTSVADIPKDDRNTEVTSALVVIALFGFGGISDLFGMDDISPLINTILFFITVIGVVDNFYDVLSWGTKTISSASNKDKDKKPVELPDKESLPFGFGSGLVTGTVVRGFTRLVSVDTERECQCEAAALYAAYTLGLPCFAFRPNALEAATLVTESMKTTSTSSSSTASSTKTLDPLMSNIGILKVLIWLMAPVAMESMKYPQLINSDPREADGLIQRLLEGSSSTEAEIFADFCDEADRQSFKDLVKWAYTEADVLLRNNIDDVTNISERLAGGAATIGDCVAAIEKW